MVRLNVNYQIIIILVLQNKIQRILDYEKFMNMLITFLSDQANTAVLQQRANEEAKLHYTNALHEGTIATQQIEGQRDRQATGRRTPRARQAKATLDRTGSEQPSTIEDLERERVRKINSTATIQHPNAIYKYIPVILLQPSKNNIFQ
ncbi:Hypothetical_protein [Hexamita inflata]|uniref:Hypothetical_protein n=1 Tax=Hexamita inflata TaxID=28002 RepID=A0AA86UUC2_9EUKA|nr:Hypothetical protein HINF_LOCUS52576 [Hexamita inflata]